MTKHKRQGMATPLPGFRLTKLQIAAVIVVSAIVSFFLTCLVIPGDIECVYYLPPQFTEEG
jgi:hypothetical protein